MLPPASSWSENTLDAISTALALKGYVVLHAALPSELILKLQTEAVMLDRDDYSRAGIGRQTAIRTNPRVRTDRIYWMEENSESAQEYLNLAEHLRLGLNSRLFLGLFDYECQYACYEPGGFYRRHLDAFEGQRNRILSSVLYLNPDWQSGDGGELVLYTDAGDRELERVSPILNTLVLFLSERFPHEVLPALRTRYSLTGWFRVNSSSEQKVDPAR